MKIKILITLELVCWFLSGIITFFSGKVTMVQFACMWLVVMFRATQALCREISREKEERISAILKEWRPRINEQDSTNSNNEG